MHALSYVSVLLSEKDKKEGKERTAVLPHSITTPSFLEAQGYICAYLCI